MAITYNISTVVSLISLFVCRASSVSDRRSSNPARFLVRPDSNVALCRRCFIFAHLEPLDGCLGAGSVHIAVSESHCEANLESRKKKEVKEIYQGRGDDSVRDESDYSRRETSGQGPMLIQSDREFYTPYILRASHASMVTLLLSKQRFASG